MTPAYSVSLCASSQGLVRSKGILRQWMTTALRIGDHLRPGDSPETITALVPLLKQQGKADLAQRMEAEGPRALLKTRSIERRAMLNGLVPLLSSSAQLALRNDAIRLEESEGRDRPVKLIAFGPLSKPKPEALPVLNREFRYSGRGLMLEDHFGVAQTSPHRLYFPKKSTLNWHPPGFSPYSLKEPLKIGRLRIGGIHASDLAPLALRQVSAPDPVDVLLISGEMAYDEALFENLFQLCGASVLLAQSDQERGTPRVIKEDQRRLVCLGPAAQGYARITFDPIDDALKLSLHKTRSGEKYLDI